MSADFLLRPVDDVGDEYRASVDLTTGAPAPGNTVTHMPKATGPLTVAVIPSDLVWVKSTAAPMPRSPFFAVPRGNYWVRLCATFDTSEGSPRPAVTSACSNSVRVRIE